jgi:phosphate transport system permease protein
MSAAPLYRPNLARRRAYGAVFSGVSLLLSATAALALFVLLYRIALDGWRYVSWDFITAGPSVLDPLAGGVWVAISGTVSIIALTALVSLPVGVGGAIYLEEFAPKNAFSRFIQLNIANLAGVPSVVYGILGLAVFVRWMRFDRSVLSGGLTMSLVVLPVIIIASREALAAVPNSIRLAAYGLGATRWQTVWHHVLPSALPGMLTGAILSLSRAVGEAAPLMILGAVTWIDFPPRQLFDQFTALPIQIFQWSEQPQPEYPGLAAAAIIVLLGILILMNGLAIGIRAWQQRQRH